MIKTGDLEKLLKKLENERNKTLTALSNRKLVERFFRMQINIFTSTYFLALVELKDEIDDLASAYRIYFRLKVNAVRYLLELYLTTAHIAFSPKADRFREVYSLAISEKINIHKIDLELHQLSRNKQTQDKLDRNRSEYTEFIKTFGNLSNRMPSSIDDFFTNGKPTQSSVSCSGITYYKHGKINYTEEMKNNSSIIEPTKTHFLLAYPLLSLETHPSISSLEDFEKFIGLDELHKKKEIQYKREQLKTLLKLVGEQMLFLIKDLLAGK